MNKKAEKANSVQGKRHRIPFSKRINERTGVKKQKDCTDNDGNEVPDGTYTFEVVATDSDGNLINATTFITALVSGVSFKDGITYLLVGDQEIPIGSVFKVKEA